MCLSIWLIQRRSCAAVERLTPSTGVLVELVFLQRFSRRIPFHFDDPEMVKVLWALQDLFWSAFTRT